MATIRKLELMHRQFGVCEGKTCGTCTNFVQGRYRSMNLKKCQVYGLTHSEASDWAKRWQACGCYNKEWTGEDIIQLVKHAPRPKGPIAECEGQESMFGGLQ